MEIIEKAHGKKGGLYRVWGGIRGKPLMQLERYMVR